MNISGIIGRKSVNIWSVTCTHTNRWQGLSQTQVLIHSAKLKTEEPPQSSPPNISIMARLCALILSDIAKLCKLKRNLPPVGK